MMNISTLFTFKYIICCYFFNVTPNFFSTCAIWNKMEMTSLKIKVNHNPLIE